MVEQEHLLFGIFFHWPQKCPGRPRIWIRPDPYLFNWPLDRLFRITDPWIWFRIIKAKFTKSFFIHRADNGSRRLAASALKCLTKSLTSKVT